MSGSGGAPGEFHWNEPASGADGSLTQARTPQQAPKRPRKLWWLAALLAVVIVVFGVVIWRRSGGRESNIDVPIGSPKDHLVSYSLDRAPVPVRRITLAQLGLPAGVKVGELFAGIGTHAYFVSTQCGEPCVDPAGWVYGLDTSTGARLFPPVQLPGFYAGQNSNTYGDCYNNGPEVALCLSYPFDPRWNGGVMDSPWRLAWVIDLRTGAITFSGRTSVGYSAGGTAPGQQEALTVGNYRGESRVVASENGRGVYGVGPHAELTWFVPGSGTPFNHNFLRQTQDAPATVAVQAPRSGEQTYRVFSVVDGKELTPSAPQGLTLNKAMVYPGGFAYRFTGNKADGVMLYNTSGALTARLDQGYAELMDSSQLPIVAEQKRWRVYSPAGKLLVDMPDQGLIGSFKVIGTKIYVSPDDLADTDEKATWQQWDLLTGQSGPSCSMALGAHFAASDGNIIVTQDQQGLEAGIDPATCRSMWTSRYEMHQIGTGLIQIDYNDNTITTLGPPP